MAPVLTPVEDPAAWRASEVADTSAWTICLGEEHVKELDAALSSTEQLNIFDIAREDASTPLLDSLLGSVLGAVDGGRGFAMLRGLPVARWGLEQTRRALWILGAHAGWAEVQDKAGSLMHDVKDTGTQFGANDTVRHFQTNHEIPFHTDGCDIFALLCFSQGASGGRSRLVSAVTAFNEVLRKRPDLAKVLQEDFHFDNRGQHPRGNVCQVHPIYCHYEGRLSIIQKPPYIMSAQRFEGVPRLTPLQLEALDMLDGVMNQPELALEFDMQAGDVVFCSNHSLCHGRTAFEDDGKPASTRHMLRLWLTIPSSRTLPPHYADTREHMHSYARREERDILVMDGSMGRLLMNSGVPQDDKLWSGLSITEDKYHPMVIDAHKKYIEAGADAITTNNYCVQPTYYRKAFADWEARIPKDAETAARLAVQAREQSAVDRPVRILGCLPPLSESHRPDVAAAFIASEGEDFCRKTYRGIAEGLLRGGPVDAFIAETMNSWAEARLALQAVEGLGVPIIISMEGALRGEDLKPRPAVAADIAKSVLEAKAAGAPIEGLSFNCAPPEDILANLQVLAKQGLLGQLNAAGIRLGAYANVHDRKKMHEAGWSVTDGFAAAPRVRADLQGAGYLASMHAFVRNGAAYVGGCCGSDPAQIRDFSTSLVCSSNRGGGKKRRRLMIAAPKCESC